MCYLCEGKKERSFLINNKEVVLCNKCYNSLTSNKQKVLAVTHNINILDNLVALAFGIRGIYKIDYAYNLYTPNKIISEKTLNKYMDIKDVNVIFK
jgi:hypothetical protein